MIDEKTIRFIVGTYELPSKLEEKIIQITSQNAREKIALSFREIYDYVAELIERFKVPFNERKALRLDHSVKPDSKTTFYELLDIKPPRQETDNKEKDPEPECIYIDEAIGILERQLDKLDLNIIRQLSARQSNGDGENLLRISPQELLSKTPLIQERLTQVVNRYEKEGNIIIPKRPIIYIDFNPLAIRFSRRRFNGNPLAFFRENGRVYEGLSRWELYKFDMGVYRALKRAGQLEEAIPKDLKPKNKGFWNPLYYRFY